MNRYRNGDKAFTVRGRQMTDVTECEILADCGSYYEVKAEGRASSRLESELFDTIADAGEYAADRKREAALW